MKSALSVVALLLAGCTAGCTEGAPPLEQSDGAEGAATAAKAVSIFRQVCIETAPDFVTTAERMARAGLSSRGLNGTRFDATDTLSAKLQSRAGQTGTTTERCSVVYEDPDNAAAISALTQAIRETGIARGTATEADLGRQRVTVWDVIIEGRGGRIIFAPSRSERLPAALYLDIPVNRAAV